jgi:DNA processing protein
VKPGESERRDRLRLIRSENVGPITFRRLLHRYGTAARALAALPELARRAGKSRLQVCSAEAAEREMAALAALGGRLVLWQDALYPPALAALDDAPPVLSVHGDAALLARPAVSVVGSRNASANGVRFARMLAEDLAAAGYVIVSGFARGIDAAAHEGGLKTGTIGVFAGGVDVVYPSENKPLHARLLAGAGALISEMPLATAPLAQHFPKRNRIISGLALGVVVVEAAPRSGTLITARRALEQGRELFAVPGSPLDPRTRGANDLIRQGATLIQGADDVLEVLAPMRERPPPSPVSVAEPDSEPASVSESEAESARRAILGLLSPSPTPVDEIIRQCQLCTAVALTALLELELSGQLQRHSGNQVSRINL